MGLLAISCHGFGLRLQPVGFSCFPNAYKNLKKSEVLAKIISTSYRLIDIA